MHLKEEEGGIRRVGRRERDRWDDLNVTYVWTSLKKIMESLVDSLTMECNTKHSIAASANFHFLLFWFNEYTLSRPQWFSIQMRIFIVATTL